MENFSKPKNRIFIRFFNRSITIPRTRSDQDLSSDTDQVNKKSASGEQLGVLGISPGNINNLVEKFERQASPLSRVDSKSPSGRSSSGRDLKSPGFVQVQSRDLKSPNLVQDVVRKSPTRNTTVSRVFPATSAGNDDKNSTTSPESGQEDQVSESKQRSQSFTSLKVDLRQDINRVSSFTRCLNGTFP